MRLALTPGAAHNQRSKDEENEHVIYIAGTNSPQVLLIAASRGLGLAMAQEFLKKGWKVVGTVPAGSGHTRLHDLADRFQEQLEIEILDICEQAEAEALRQRLSRPVFDMLFVNAGTTTHEEMVTTDEFVCVMVTNALCPLRVVDTLGDLVPHTT